MTEPMLTLRDIVKSFDGQPVLRGVSFDLKAGDNLVLLGPSGCGKTTLLRIIAGLETADSGQVLLQGNDLTAVPVHQRGFGMVFQDYALFPHKNVFDNVAFGLRMQQWPAERMAARVTAVLELVGMAAFAGRPIYDLSGGEQQRVALARSLAPAPRLLLLDEPLGALDRALRERLMLDLRAILEEAGDLLDRPEGMTAVYVTHDQAEAFAIADQVLVLNDGRVEQAGTPTAIYRQPKTPFVAGFLGMENLFSGKILADGRVETALGVLAVADHVRAPDTAVSVLVRPEAGRLALDAGTIVNGRLTDLSFRGRFQIATFVVGENRLKLEFDSGVALPAVGTAVDLTLAPEAIQLLEGG